MSDDNTMDNNEFDRESSPENFASPERGRARDDEEMEEAIESVENGIEDYTTLEEDIGHQLEAIASNGNTNGGNTLQNNNHRVLSMLNLLPRKRIREIEEEDDSEGKRKLEKIDHQELSISMTGMTVL